jgi:hypothetical protein
MSVVGMDACLGRNCYKKYFINLKAKYPSAPADIFHQ